MSVEIEATVVLNEFQYLKLLIAVFLCRIQAPSPFKVHCTMMIIGSSTSHDDNKMLVRGRLCAEQ
jgi:hypothetical protein